VDINLAKPNNKNFDNFKSIKISLNNNDLKAFFIFLFHKANIFDKKNIYGSLLKNIFPDNVLKQMLINILNFYVKMADEIKDFLSSYIHRIEEFRDILNKIKQRLENEKIIIKILRSIKKFLLKFYQDYSDKKFGTTDESNLRGSVKFLQTEIVKKIYDDSTILDLYTNLITIAMKKTDNHSDEIILIVCQIVREVFLFYIRLYEAIFID
ncbi:hypothetical protein CWI39_3133p0010, partial [Hamiltosporidium magnivora]